MPKAPNKPRRDTIAQAIDQATRGPALRADGAVAKAKKKAQAKLASAKRKARGEDESR